MTAKHDLTEQEFDELKGWWQDHGQAVPYFEFMPKRSLTICEGDSTILACWYYTDKDSSTIIPDWLIGNPMNSITTLLKAVALLAGEFDKICKEGGFRVIRSFTWNPTIAKYAERFGYEFEPKPVYHYGKLIN